MTPVRTWGQLRLLSRYAAVLLVAVGALVVVIARAVPAQADQGGCTTAWVQGFNIGSCVDDQNSDNAGYPDAYVNYVPSAGTCAIQIQVWDDNNHQYSGKQVGCGKGRQVGNPAGPVAAPVSLHAYARLDLNGTHFFVGDSPKVALGQGIVSGQGGCTTYGVQGFSIGVCVNDQHTGTTAYPDIYVNSTPFPTSCNVQIQTWDDNNHQLSGKSAPCVAGHYLGAKSGPFSSPTNLHSYVRLDLNGGSYAGPNSPTISVMPAFVALGDSYSAGEGTPPFDAGTDTSTNKCHRSPNAYSRLYAQFFPTPWGRPDLVACSGVVIADVTARNSTVPSEGPQTQALSPGTRLVTLSVSGNDVGFNIVADCIVVGRTSCWQKELAGIDARIDAQYSRLVTLYQTVAHLAPNAQFVVVTYPNVFPATLPAQSCANLGAVASMSQTDLDTINEAWTRLNNVIVHAAQTVGTYLLDEGSAFQGHDVCSSTPWANGIILPDTQESFHPNASGYSQEANDLNRLLGP